LADNISHQVVREPDILNDRFCIEKGAWDAVQLSEYLYLEKIIKQVKSQFEGVSQTNKSFLRLLFSETLFPAIVSIKIHYKPAQ
jgi:hypothetical protein